MWLQKEITLTARPRGFHLITHEILRELPELANLKVCMMNVLLEATVTEMRDIKHACSACMQAQQGIEL